VSSPPPSWSTASTTCARSARFTGSETQGRLVTRSFYKGTHGMSYTRTYRSWKMMLSRVRGSSDARHRRDYLGIKVCDRWLSFENFLADMGPRPPNKTIDRFPDNKGNYEPGNCRWATPAEQQRNTRRTVMMTYAGITLCKEDWAKYIGISINGLHKRLKRMTVEDALSYSGYSRNGHK
jgi:hypothetical protein